MYVMGLIFLLFSAGGFAKDMEWASLVHDGVNHQVRQGALDSYRDGLISLGTSLLTCKSDSKSFAHPLTQRESSFNINTKGNLCAFTFIRDSRWVYHCDLTKAEQHSLSLAFLEWANSSAGVGDFPLSIQHILFDATVCASEKR